jgi:CelD/BcsL family acetyltransferase involved in cellulose biosynthesis
LVDPTKHPDWDNQVGPLPNAGFFHTAAWARVLAETHSYAPLYLATRTGDRLSAVLPLMEVSSWLTGCRAISLPFTDAVEPLGADAETWPRLYAAARNLARERHWKYLELRGGGPWLATAQPCTQFYRHVLELENGEAGQFARCDEAVRKAVRKAERSGLTVEFSTEETALREFFDLFCRTRRKHGAPPQPFRFFACIRQHVLQRGHGWIVLARQGSRPVAGAIYFHAGRNAVYKFGASDERLQHLRGNNMVMWAAIGKYAREGFATFDFGRTSVGNEGLRKFKLGWGAAESLLSYWRVDMHTGNFVTVPDRASGSQAALFRILPVSLSRLVGRFAYRHIA